MEKKKVPRCLRAQDIAVRKIRPKTMTSAFKCTLCDYESDVVRNFNRHRRTHNPFNCVYCHFKTTVKRKFEQHVVLHKYDAPFHCHKCNFITAVEGDLIRHRKIHFGDSPHYCPLCKATFKIKAKLEEHIRRHVGEKPFACPDCHLTFSFESSVIRHQEANRCSKSFKSFNQSSSMITVGPTRGRKSVYGTDKNLVNFKKRENIAHNEKPGSVLQKTDLLFQKSRILGSGSTENSPDNSNAGGIPQLTKCIQIPALLPKDVLMKLAIPAGISKPKKRVTVPQKDPTTAHVFNCALCPRSFSRIGYLNRHIRTHTQERPFACPFCSFTTAWYENLSRHYRTVHSTSVDVDVEGSVNRHQEANRFSKIFKSFNKSSSVITVGPKRGRKSVYGSDDSVNFNKRGNITNNEKPDSVRQKSDLLFQNSRILESGSTANSSNNSNVAGIPQLTKCIQIPALLPKHVLMKLATPPDISKPKNPVTVPQKDRTTAHVLNCGLCRRSFSRIGHLNSHIRTHTKERPFACSSCSFTTAWSENLSRHNRRVHSSSVDFDVEGGIIRHQEENQCSNSFNKSSSVITVGPMKGLKRVYGSDKNLVNFKKHGNVENNEKPGSVLQKSDLHFQKSRILERGSTANSPDYSNVEGTPQLTKCIQIPALLPKDLIKLAIPPDISKPKNRVTIPQKDPTTADLLNWAVCPTSFSSIDNSDPHMTGHSSSVDCQDAQSQKIRREPLNLTNLEISERITNSGALKSSGTVGNKIVCEFCDAKVSTAFELLNHLRHHTGQTLYKCTQSGCKFKTIDKKRFNCHSCVHVQFIS